MLELELQGAQAAPAEADPRHHPALAQELGHKAGGQGHSYRRRLQVTGSAQWEVGAGAAWVETKRGIQFLDQGLNKGPLHWKHGVLATGPPGKSQKMFKMSLFHFYF